MNYILKVVINVAFYCLLIILTEHTYKYIDRNKQTSLEKFSKPYFELVANNIRIAN